MSERLERELASILEPLGVEEVCLTPIKEPEQPLVLILYDEHDEDIWKGLQKHLDLLMRRYQHVNWITHRLDTNGWMYADEEEITTHIREARLIILGVSVDFLLTLYGSSILTALRASWTERQESDSWIDHILPVILRPVSSQDLDLGYCRSAAPDSYKSLIGAKPRDSACVEIITAISTAINELILQQ